MMNKSPEAYLTKDSYRVESVGRLKAMIDKNGGLYEGDICPECDSPFERILLYMDYTPTELKGIYIIKCSGCGLTVRDIWETKEVWELTAEAIPE